MSIDGFDRQRILIEAHKARLEELEVIAAKFGISCPPEVKIEIREINDKIRNLENGLNLDSISLSNARKANALIDTDLKNVDNQLSRIVVKEERAFHVFGIKVFTYIITRTLAGLVLAIVLIGTVGILTGLIEIPNIFIQNLPTGTGTAQPTQVGTPLPTLEATTPPILRPTSIVEQPTIIVPILPTPTLTPTLTSTPTPTPTLTLTPTPTRTPRPTDTPIPTFSPPAAVDEKREERVIVLINDQRAASGCEPLHYSSELTGAARRHSVDMATHNMPGHTGSDGSQPGERITQAGYRWAYGIPGAKGWEEDISVYRDSADEVVGNWMQDDNREPILNCNYHDIGVGYARSQEGVPYWTAVFTRGRR